MTNYIRRREFIRYNICKYPLTGMIAKTTQGSYARSRSCENALKEKSYAQGFENSPSQKNQSRRTRPRPRPAT
jgi:hypothetical protein